MHIFRGILHLVWHIVIFPIHLVLTVIKIVIIGPLILIATLACVIFGCLALFSPATLSSINIQPPDAGRVVTFLFQHVISPAVSNGQPVNVTSVVQGNAIVVSWTGNPSGAQWYEVLRKTVDDPTWRRIAIVPAASTTDGHYEFTDTALQHGITYLYAVTAVTSGSGEGTPVESAYQVVAP